MSSPTLAMDGKVLFVGTIRAGTAGWTDPSLVRCGRFYPPGVKDAEARLRHYAALFSLVEVDSTHYVPLARRNAELWVERTPPGFFFQVKAHGLITGHPCRPQALPVDLQNELPPALKSKHTLLAGEVPEKIVAEVAARFVDALSPLAAAGRLGAVLLQFPPWLSAGRENARAVLRAAESLGGLPAAIELRHPSWVGDFRLRTEQFLTRHDLSLVCTEGPPELEASLPPLPIPTPPRLAVLRLHGKRPTGEGGPPRRAHRPDELAAWGERARQMAGEAESVHVVFANCWEDLAVRDALAFSTALSLPPPPRPLPLQAELPMM